MAYDNAGVLISDEGRRGASLLFVSLQWQVVRTSSQTTFVYDERGLDSTGLGRCGWLAVATRDSNSLNKDVHCLKHWYWGVKQLFHNNQYKHSLTEFGLWVINSTVFLKEAENGSCDVGCIIGLACYCGFRPSVRLCEEEKNTFISLVCGIFSIPVRSSHYKRNSL